MVRDFRHADRSDGVCYLSGLCHQHINLLQPRNDPVSRMLLPFASFVCAVCIH